MCEELEEDHKTKEGERTKLALLETLTSCQVEMKSNPGIYTIPLLLWRPKGKQWQFLAPEYQKEGILLQ